MKFSALNVDLAV